MSWKKLDEILMGSVALGAITLAVKDEKKGSQSSDKEGGARTVTRQTMEKEREAHIESQRDQFRKERQSCLDLGDTRQAFDEYVEWKAHQLHREALAAFHRRSGPNPGRSVGPDHWVEAAYSRFFYMKNRHLYQR